jgi:hypothetical protein
MKAFAAQASPQDNDIRSLDLRVEERDARRGSEERPQPLGFGEALPRAQDCVPLPPGREDQGLLGSGYVRRAGERRRDGPGTILGSDAGTLPSAPQVQNSRGDPTRLLAGCLGPGPRRPNRWKSASRGPAVLRRRTSR